MSMELGGKAACRVDTQSQCCWGRCYNRGLRAAGEDRSCSLRIEEGDVSVSIPVLLLVGFVLLFESGMSPRGLSVKELGPQLGVFEGRWSL